MIWFSNMLTRGFRSCQQSTVVGDNCRICFLKVGNPFQQIFEEIKKETTYSS